MHVWYAEVADGSTGYRGDELDEAHAWNLAYGSVAGLVNAGEIGRIDYGVNGIRCSVLPARTGRRDEDIATTLASVQAAHCARLAWLCTAEHVADLGRWILPERIICGTAPSV